MYRRPVPFPTRTTYLLSVADLLIGSAAFCAAIWFFCRMTASGWHDVVYTWHHSPWWVIILVYYFGFIIYLVMVIGCCYLLSLGCLIFGRGWSAIKETRQEQRRRDQRQQEIDKYRQEM